MCKKLLMKTKVDKSIFEDIAVKIYNNDKTDNKIEKFSEIKLKQLANNNGNAIACPDQYVGIINIEKNGCVSSWNVGWKKDSIFIKDKTNRQSNSNALQNEDISVLAIVLESPHKDEFNYENKNALGPAIGTTGDNIEKYLPEVVFNYLPSKKNDCNISYEPNDQIPNGTYKVLLINAIQYQCSLGEDTKLYRDKIFSKMWEDIKVRQDFIDRLKSHNPKVVINCCTKGDFSEGEKELRKLVQNEINNHCDSKDILNLRAAHPSSLHFRNGLSKVEKEDKKV